MPPTNPTHAQSPPQPSPPSTSPPPPSPPNLPSTHPSPPGPSSPPFPPSSSPSPSPPEPPPPGLPPSPQPLESPAGLQPGAPSPPGGSSLPPPQSVGEQVATAAIFVPDCPLSTCTAIGDKIAAQLTAASSGLIWQVGGRTHGLARPSLGASKPVGRGGGGPPAVLDACMRHGRVAWEQGPGRGRGKGRPLATAPTPAARPLPRPQFTGSSQRDSSTAARHLQQVRAHVVLLECSSPKCSPSVLP